MPNTEFPLAFAVVVARIHPAFLRKHFGSSASEQAMVRVCAAAGGWQMAGTDQIVRALWIEQVSKYEIEHKRTAKEGGRMNSNLHIFTFFYFF